MIKQAYLKIKQRWLPRLYGLLAKGLLKGIASTCRYRVEGLEEYLTLASQNKCILMFWHNRLAMTAEILRRCAPAFRYAAFISRSRDGEVIAVLAESYSNSRAIRVPHNARGIALQELIRTIKSGSDVVLITPDGPRGPQYQVKPGIVMAARKTNTPVVPMTWSASRLWRLSTWDGLMLPKPFSTVSVRFGTGIRLEAETSLETDSARLQEALLRLERT